MSPRRNWDSPNPSLASECAPPPRTGGWAHSPAGEGLGESDSDDLRKNLELLLCAINCPVRTVRISSILLLCREGFLFLPCNN